jgi:tRNA(Ile)-lysidine synthase TilS/MesJ
VIRESKTCEITAYTLSRVRPKLEALAKKHPQLADTLARAEGARKKASPKKASSKNASPEKASPKKVALRDVGRSS